MALDLVAAMDEEIDRSWPLCEIHVPYLKLWMTMDDYV